MAVIKKFKGESIKALLRRFKKNVEKRDVINEVKRREHFIKPSVKRKLAKEVATKREKRRQEDQKINSSAA